MDTSGKKQIPTLKNEFLKILDDFTEYLSSQYSENYTCFELSEKSQQIANQWSAESSTELPFFFEGSETSDVFIIDSKNTFFKEDSGALLFKILKAMQLSPESVYICNAADAESVHRKIKANQPKVIITLGSKASQCVLKTQEPVQKIRGRFQTISGIKVMPTFHPSLLIHQPEFKRHVWDDMKCVMAHLGIKHDS
jgi:DNA polymerase